MFHFMTSSRHIGEHISGKFQTDYRGCLRFMVFISRENLGRSENCEIPARPGFFRHMKTRLWSRDVFLKHAATESDLFSVLRNLSSHNNIYNAKFLFFSPLEMISFKMWETLLSMQAKYSHNRLRLKTSR